MFNIIAPTFRREFTTLVVVKYFSMSTSTDKCTRVQICPRGTIRRKTKFMEESRQSQSLLLRDALALLDTASELRPDATYTLKINHAQREGTDYLLILTQSQEILAGAIR